MPGTGALSMSAIAGYASAAGFTGDDLTTSIAVAMAESGGNPLSHNTNRSTGDNSYGLWQINMIDQLGPDRRKAFHIASNDELFKPEVNARAAHMIKAQQGWSGWTTYKRGLHRKFLADAAIAAKAPAAPGATPVSSVVPDVVGKVENALNPLAGVPEAIQGFTAGVFKLFANIEGMAFALGFIVLGIVILLREPLGQVAKKVVTK